MRGISREAAKERCSGKVWFNPFATLSWYYSQGDQRLGPVSEEELLRLAGEGTITPMTRVWKETVTFGRVSPDYIGSLPHWPGGPAL